MTPDDTESFPILMTPDDTKIFVLAMTSDDSKSFLLAMTLFDSKSFLPSSPLFPVCHPRSRGRLMAPVTGSVTVSPTAAHSRLYQIRGNKI